MKRLNRLWVWISAILVGVILIVALFPFAYRSIVGPGGWQQHDPANPPFDERNPDNFRKTLEGRIWRNLAITLAVGAIIGLIAGVLLTRWLVAPFKQLEDGARAVARRQLDYRITEGGSSEMRAVAGAFNHMALELERQEKLRRDLLADVTHELRHPIHILQGNLQAILDGVYALDMEEIARLSEHTQGLTNLVNDLHELALAEASQLPLSKRPTELNELVASAVESFQPLCEERKLSFVLELAPEEIVCELDPDRIRQALQNLIGNAIRYTPQAGQIKVTLSAADESALIVVADSGIGIKAEDLPHVFDRFYRADSARDRAASGTGLGLAIALAIIQAHGGGIKAQSAGVGQGSKFTIELPVIG